MMDKNLTNPSYSIYKKRITSYVDGSMSPEEKSEFEAFISVHPEFEALIKDKEDEFLLLKSLIPSPVLTKQSAESIENEMKLSIFNLLKEEPTNLLDRFKNFWEEWSNRPKINR